MVSVSTVLLQYCDDVTLRCRMSPCPCMVNKHAVQCSHVKQYITSPFTIKAKAAFSVIPIYAATKLRSTASLIESEFISLGLEMHQKTVFCPRSIRCFTITLFAAKAVFSHKGTKSKDQVEQMPFQDPSANSSKLQREPWGPRRPNTTPRRRPPATCA